MNSLPMEITLNGEKRHIEPDTTVAMLIRELDLEGKRIAVEINEILVPRSSFESHLLKAGDDMEIVQAIGGG